MLQLYRGFNAVKSLSTEINYVKHVQALLSISELSIIKTPCRSTFILKRTHPIPNAKEYADPKTFLPKKKKHKLYELVECTEATKESNINVILKTLVPGLGEAGDLVTVKRSLAYNKLLLPGIAMYATPEATQKAEQRKQNKDTTDHEERYSSLDVPRAIGVLTRLIVTVTMHQENKWVIEPWHIRASFRKAGVHIMRDDCIELPKRIEGPNINNEGKEFLVNVTINKKEKVAVRCRLHHWHPDIMKRQPPVALFWTKRAEPLFEEEAETLLSMPLPPIPKDAVIKE